MKTKMWKYFYDEERTEKWLNDLAAEGLHCVGVGINMHKYSFEQGEPGEYSYRIILLENKLGHPESVRYLNFLNESGIEYVGHVWRHVLLRKKTADGPFDLFTDRDSLIKHYRGMINASIGGIAGMGLVAALNIRIVIRYLIPYIPYTNWAIGVNSVVVLSLVLLVISFCLQWRRYATRIKKLKRERGIYE